MANEATAYRPDIDGLRAVAVGSVVLFHVGLAALPGGFVGVDVFFVISGFLITSIIDRDLADGKFSLLGFYDRRFRRILPALLVVIGVSLAVGYFFLLPDDMQRLRDQSGYSAVGLANLYFLNNSDYFDVASDIQPMLHMWSLGVEEQFYLVWPLALMLLWKVSGKNVRIVVPGFLIVVIAASLAASVWLTPSDPSFAFYMLPTRAWELALGALLVFAPRLRGVLVWIIPLVGLVAIGAACAFLTREMTFPGWLAIIPCIGAAAVIWPRTASGGGRILEIGPMVGLGKISYSLYLWHWPVIVFWRLTNPGLSPSFLEAAGLVGIATLLAILSYTFVEQPFRKFSFGKLPTVLGGAAAMAATVAAALVMPTQTSPVSIASVKAPAATAQPISLIDPAQLAEMQALYLDVGKNRDNHGSKHECFLGSGNKSVEEFKSDLCLPAPDGRKRVLLVGESFADMYELAFRAAYPEVQLLVATASGCHPTFPLQGRDVCMALIEKVIKTAGRVDAVVLASKWELHDATKLAETAKTFRAITPRVVVLGTGVLYNADLPKILIESAKRNDQGAIVDAAMKYDVQLQLDVAMSAAAAAAGLEYHSVLKALCPEGKCMRIVPDSLVPMHVDYGHFTRQGAAVMVGMLKKNGLLSAL